jgi:hypothetical protein
MSENRSVANGQPKLSADDAATERAKAKLAKLKAKRREEQEDEDEDEPRVARWRRIEDRGDKLADELIQEAREKLADPDDDGTPPDTDTIKADYTCQEIRHAAFKLAELGRSLLLDAGYILEASRTMAVKGD